MSRHATFSPEIGLRAAKEQAARRREQYEKHPKRCMVCQEPLPYEGHTNRKYCNRSCAAKSNNVIAPKREPGPRSAKPCARCGKETTARTYCSRECANQTQYEVFIQNWLAGELIMESESVPSPIRRFMLEEAQHKCSECGWDKKNPVTGRCPLTIDHINGNATDNHRENLRVLCPNCHSLTPTYGNLNRGKSRRTRRYAPVEMLRNLSVDEFNAFFSEIELSGNAQHHLMFRLLYATGMRGSELLDVRRQDVNFGERTIQAKNQVVSFSEDLSIPLKFHHDASTEQIYLFESQRRDRMTNRWLQLLARKYGDKAGIKDMHPDRLRHTRLRGHGV